MVSGHIMLFALALAFQLGLAHSQSQVGFISIDCGSSREYYDNKTGIAYSTDAPYTNAGENFEVESKYLTGANIDIQFDNLRSFPNGTKSCYTILYQQGKITTKYLIRARFLYGNYDSKNVLPEFDLYLGVNLWSTINFSSSTSVVSKELVHVISSNVTYICLVNTGLGTPFISAIELRPFFSEAYEMKEDTIELQLREDFGNEYMSVRFPNDLYDRMWEPSTWSPMMTTLNTNLSFDDGHPSDWFHTPSVVMGTAVTPTNPRAPIEFNWKVPDKSSKYYIYMYFGEVEKLQTNQKREFVVKLNGELASPVINPNYLYSTVSYNVEAITGARDWFNYSIERTASSTLPPIMNALEVFIIKDFLQSETAQGDVGALKYIQKTYGIVKDWVADPCTPQNHTWSGIRCTYSNFDPPRIISLNLSSSTLTGTITDYIFGLKLLQHLDLSNNKLSGNVPDFLSQMTSLTLLNLNGNNLTGKVPSKLIEKSLAGTLQLSVEGNPNLCTSGSCLPTVTTARKKSNILILIIASVVAVGVILVIIATAVLWRAKRKNQKRDKGHRARPEPSDLLTRN